MNDLSNRTPDMAAKKKQAGFGLSRRRLIVSAMSGMLAAVNGEAFARRVRRKRRDCRRTCRCVNPTIDLTFAGPFRDGKPLLATPLRSDWVGIERLFAAARDYSPSAKDRLDIRLDFRGETKQVTAKKKILVNPYRIAILVVAKDKQGREHTAVDQVIEYSPISIELHLGGGMTLSRGDSTRGYGGTYGLPIKLHDISAIRLRLSKISE